MSGIARHHSEWLSLVEVSGPFLTLPVLVRVFPQGLPKVHGKKLGRLRAAYEEWAHAQDAKAPDASALHATWVQLVLGELLEFDGQTLRSGDGLPSGLVVSLAEHHETLRPSMAILEPSGRAKAGTPRLLIAVWPSDQDLESAVPAARWAASPLERMAQLCRSTGVRLGLVTNGERWTVVDAPVGQAAGYASWYAGLWLQEPITLAAFDALLGVRRFFAVADTDTIETLLDESVGFQQEVTDQLGYQVRRAVEVLVQALDRADLDRKRELLRDVPPARLYDAALTVMMRLVFLFCAEERGLLLLGDETYDANYAVSTLRALLREEADRVGVEVLERRQDAWARLLATFRAVHGGVEHEALRLPALGGSLFDPDRFPFLEGRAAGTSWLATPASPLPIDNRTVLHLLEALQLLRTRGDGGTTEARKLSYRALDIEQIGHVYEGLLDHVAVRVDADTLGLAGTKDKEPELTLDELNRERRHGMDGLIGFLKEHTGRSTSALRNDLDAEPDEVAEQRLLVACGNDKALVKHIAPYHALIRKDVWGYPQIYRAGSFMVTGGSERRQTGTHYTPKSLTEQIVTETLEPLVYVGPAEGKPRDTWKLRSATELLDLKICDMAMGSGAFLVQVCRWLAERVVEAWEEAERQGAAISADGEVLEKTSGHDLLPPDREERLSFARRLVAERCIYGVDINPMAVELAKLSLWLVTLAKGRPFGFLDHNLRCGDSLLGIHRLDQLTELSMTPNGKRQRRLFGQNIEGAVHEAVETRQRLRALPIRDIHDVEVMARLDADARRKLELPERIADAFIGEVFASGGNGAALEKTLTSLAVQAGQVIEADREMLASMRRRSAVSLSTDRPVDKLARQPFHWPLEFPEVFPGGFNAIIGNPPFLKGTAIGKTLGACYRAYLGTSVGHGVKASYADLCAFFMLRALSVAKDEGGIGLVATNTISQGDTREMGLDQVYSGGSRPYWSRTDVPWTGAAAVVVTLIVIRKNDGWLGRRLLNGKEVEGITTFLTEGAEESFHPQRLASNRAIAFKGSTTGCNGFVLDSAEARRILDKDPKYADVVQPFIGGQDFNSSPMMTTDRWVINFRDWSYEKASQYPLCIELLRKRVKPYFDSRTGQIHEKDFWKFSDKRLESYKSIANHKRVLFHAFTSKHLAFGFVGTGIVYSAPHVVVALQGYDHFAVLQSSFHLLWVIELCSTMGVGIRYAPSDLLETFPFPNGLIGDARREIHEDLLVDLGLKYYRARSKYMEENKVGLTEFYNTFHAPNEQGEVISCIRRIHSSIDQELCGRYFIEVNLDHQFVNTKIGVRYLPAKEKQSLVLARLAELNRRGYERELAAGLHSDALPLEVSRVTRTGRGAANATHAQPQLEFEAWTAATVNGTASAGAILGFLSAHDGWHAKADILSATGLADVQWNAAIADLVDNGLVERQGERRGTRYRSLSEFRGERGAKL